MPRGPRLPVISLRLPSVCKSANFGPETKRAFKHFVSLFAVGPCLSGRQTSFPLGAPTRCFFFPPLTLRRVLLPLSLPLPSFVVSRRALDHTVPFSFSPGPGTAAFFGAPGTGKPAPHAHFVLFSLPSRLSFGALPLFWDFFFFWWRNLIPC